MTTRDLLRRPGRLGRALAIAGLVVMAAGCYHQQMANQERYKPLAESDIFPDRRASRQLIEGTVARGHLNEDTVLYTGKAADGTPSTVFPYEVTPQILARGQERYNIYCTPCHDRTGSGNGIVVQRGYQQAASFHVDRLREAAPGYLFDVITNGFGAMPNYRSQIPVPDRWAIIAYVRVLQFSQHADVSLLSAEDLERLGPRPVAQQPQGEVQ